MILESMSKTAGGEDEQLRVTYLGEIKVSCLDLCLGGFWMNPQHIVVSLLLPPVATLLGDLQPREREDLVAAATEEENRTIAAAQKRHLLLNGVRPSFYQAGQLILYFD